MDEHDTSGQSGGPAAEPDEKSVALIAAMFSQLAKTLLAFKLYAPANQLRREMFDSLLQRAKAAFEQEEIIAVDLEPNRLLWHNVPVLELRESENNFIFNLYKDGARQIGLRRGLTSAEIERLLDIIDVRPEVLDPHYSVVDALWEAELEHVSHIAVDGFTELLADETADHPIVSTSLASRFERLITDLVGAPPTMRQPDKDEGSKKAGMPALPPEAPDETLIRVSDTIASPLRALLREPKGVEDEAADRWVQQAQSRPDELLATIEDLVMYWLEQPDAPFSDDELIELLTQLTRHWLSHGNFAVAGELLTRLGHLRFELPERADVVSAVLMASGGSALHELLVAEDGLQNAVWDVSEAIAFFDRHLAVGDEELLELLKLRLSDKSRRLLALMLVQQVAERPGFWADRFPQLPAEVVALLLAKLGEHHHGKPEMLAVFEAALEHEDDTVRLAALCDYPGEYTEALRARLLGLLDSTSIDVRSAAIEQLGLSGDGSIGPFLVNRFRRVGLADLPPVEVRALSQAILRLGSNRYTPFIRGQLESTGVLRGRDPRQHDQVVAVIEALASVREAAPLELFRDVRASSRGTVRDLCDELWRTVVSEWNPGDVSKVDLQRPAQTTAEHEALGPSPMTPGPSTLSISAERRPLPEEAHEEVVSPSDDLVTFLDEEST